MANTNNQEILSNKDLSQVNGGTNNRKYPIDSGNPHCPLCGAPLQKLDHDGQLRIDNFKCSNNNCNKRYVRHWDGDEWTD